MNRRKRNAGFSLVELTLAMAVVLILIGGLLYAANRVMAASRQTTAAQSVTNMATAEQTFSHGWEGYSPLATNLGGSEKSQTQAASYTLDQELPSTEAASLDTAFVNGGYTFVYKAGGTAFNDTAGDSVNPIFEFTAVPINISDPKAYCSDPSGTWFNALGTGATPASGAGCKADGFNLQ